MTPWIHGYMHISEKKMLIMCVDNCLVFVQNNLFRILLSGIVNFICFITCPTNINCLCNFVSRYLFKNVAVNKQYCYTKICGF